MYPTGIWAGTTYNASRAEDHDVVLAEILGYAREHKPDLIVHTGDLFDVVRPAYPDMARGISALQELAVTAPVVVICGNHDSPALFDVFGQLLGPRSPIRFVSRARTPDQGGILSFPAAGDDVIRLAPLPFVHANRMLDGFEEPGTWAALYADRIHRVEEVLARGLSDGFDNRRDVAIFAAHLYVGGAVLSGSERRIQVGENYATHLSHLPVVTYAAFGHIHKPQPLPGSLINGCYAGSPSSSTSVNSARPSGPSWWTPGPVNHPRSSRCHCRGAGRCGDSMERWNSSPRPHLVPRARPRTALNNS